MDTGKKSYQEPELAYLILDYGKEKETRECIASVKAHTKFSHKIIYLHNGNSEAYPYELFKEGLIDQLIQTQANTGLGIGTRDLFAASFSPYSFYLQNDQLLKRDFTQEEFGKIKNLLKAQFVSPHDGSLWAAGSIDLAGGVCGLHQYSERGHITKTEFYKQLERELPLNYFGAGPYHDGMWREDQIRRFYNGNKLLHYTYENMLVADNGYRALRENPDGSKWEHKTQSRKLRLLSGPVTQKHMYPNFTDAEWEEVLRTQSWPEWQIPQNDLPHSLKDWRE